MVAGVSSLVKTGISRCERKRQTLKAIRDKAMQQTLTDLQLKGRL